MPKTIAVGDLERQLRSVIDDVVHQHSAYVVARDNRPEAVLMPYDDFVHLQELQGEAVLTRFDRLLAKMAARNASYSDEEIEADVTAIIEDPTR